MLRYEDDDDRRFFYALDFDLSSCGKACDILFFDVKINRGVFQRTAQKLLLLYREFLKALIV